MNTREHFELFRYLMEQCCLLQEDIVFVNNIAEWCKEYGMPEHDRERLFKLILKSGQGCKMLVREDIQGKFIDERINALMIRSQLRNVAYNRADTLDTIQKKLAYLFLSEYSTSIPGITDEMLADDWVFERMDELGYFKT
ncbi:MAG: hypothetical protein HZA11_08540 [Nitrospirae bacterium]|nr:hypothetical protein [Nitrospirota bacterium]